MDSPLKETDPFLRKRNRIVPVLAVAGALIVGLCASAWANDVVVSATVDKTNIDVGTPINLTLTLSGDVSDIQVPNLTLPDGFAVVGRSQSSSFSIRGGAVQRSVELVYVLLPQRAGTFQLGPFPFTSADQKKRLQTEPITITVKKAAVPPALQEPQGGRFTL